MKEAVLKEQLLEITEAIQSASKPVNATEEADGVYVSEQSGNVEATIDQLRMQIKYLLFDLEASRRENRYLRQMLEMRPPQPRKGREDDKDNNDNGWK
jgi:hypothetical protein